MKGKIIGLLVVLSAASTAFPVLAGNVSPADHYRMIRQEDSAMRPSDASPTPIMDHSGMNKDELKAAAAKIPTAQDHKKMIEKENPAMQASDAPQAPVMDQYGMK